MQKTNGKMLCNAIFVLLLNVFISQCVLGVNLSTINESLLIVISW